LDEDPAFTIVASEHRGVFAPHRLEPARGVVGRLRFNPLYVLQPEDDGMKLRLRFPSVDYEQEWGACRQYLPEEVFVSLRDVDAIHAGALNDELRELIRRRIVIDVPQAYF
jgi:hypothetical protein